MYLLKHTQSMIHRILKVYKENARVLAARGGVLNFELGTDVRPEVSNTTL